MKTLFSTVILWAGILMTYTFGQSLEEVQDYTQNLNIYAENELVAVVSGQSVHEISESDEWRNLMSSFRKNLESVKDQIPEYLIYKIEYQKDYNLIVEEVEGIVRYDVSEGTSQFAQNQSKAILKAKDFEIQLNFQSLDDVIERDYETMITSAMSKLDRKPSRFSRAYSPKYNYDYSYSNKKMLDKKVEKKSRVVIPANGTIGIYKSNPIYELNIGIGISFGREDDSKYNLFYGFLGDVAQYDRNLNRMKNSALVGVAWKTKRFGTFHVAFPADEGTDPGEETLMEDIKVRVGATYHSGTSLAVTINAYYQTTGDVIPSVTFGFSF